MMTINQSQWSSNQGSSIYKINDKIIHQDNYNDVQQSSSCNSNLVTKRGFKPSDMFDPQKKEFLTNLSYKLFPNDVAPERDTSPYLEYESEELQNKPVFLGEKEVDLNKIFTPAPDAEETMIKKNRKFEKTFASSAFYVPGIHPTVKEQMDLARAISRSLSDSSNQLSKGQSMYVNRKKRSVKWVHEGKGRNTSNSCATPTPTANHDTPYRPPSSLRQQTNKYGTYPKPALKNSSLPKIEPFPEVARKPASIPAQTYNIPISVTPTKLNDVYASPKSPRLPLMNGKSFNTAPRGWGQVKDYYRPITFDDDGKTFSASYTDY